MKRISLEVLLKDCDDDDYLKQYRLIRQKIEAGEIRPVEASGTNGKKPALYRAYWILEAGKDYSGLLEELEYRMVPAISIDYYRNHPEMYEADRQWVLLLNDFLKSGRESLAVPVSMNERSFEIWHREKFLQREKGRKILKRCGMSAGDLNYYETAEPLSYYVRTRKTPQNLLIIENKDTFYSMRRTLINGHNKILGVEIGTLIYGAGKGILRSYQDFMFCAEPHMRDAGNSILYFGDMDYEGIGIFERLAENFEKAQPPGRDGECGEAVLKTEPFVSAYEAMLGKAGRMDMEELPDSSDQQNQNLSGRFFSYFNHGRVEQMLRILESGRFLPQEMLNVKDFVTDQEFIP